LLRGEYNGAADLAYTDIAWWVRMGWPAINFAMTFSARWFPHGLLNIMKAESVDFAGVMPV